MGCGVSSQVSAARDPQQHLSGTLTILLKSAFLENPDSWIGQIDAYVIFRFGKKTKKTSASSLSGQYPIWNERIEFNKISEDEMFLLEVWNDNTVLADELLGEAAVSLLPIKFGGSTSLVVDLFDSSRNKSGSVSIDVSFRCNFPMNPIAQKIDYSGFLTIQIKAVSIARNDDETLPDVINNLTAICRLNHRIIGQTSVYYNSQLGQPNWFGERIIGFREAAEDIVEISLYDASTQSQFELFAKSYVSLCRTICEPSKNRLILQWQGKYIGTINLEMELKKSSVISSFAEIGNESPLIDMELNVRYYIFIKQFYKVKGRYSNDFYSNKTEQALQKKKLLFEKRKELDQDVIKAMIKTINRPELELEKKKMSEYLREFKWEETPKEGEHQFQYSDGSIYKGIYKDHLRHGQGTLICLQGLIKYEGEWKNDKFHGNGKFVYGDFCYQGEFALGRKHGKGTIQLPRAQQLTANYKFGELEGELCLTENSKIILNAVFLNGRAVEIKREDGIVFKLSYEGGLKKHIEQEQDKYLIEEAEENKCQSNRLEMGIRMKSGQLFSKNYKYCLALTNRGTLKVISVLHWIGVWDNGYSDPYNRPYFFWINSEGQFQVVSSYGVTFNSTTSGKNVYGIMRNSGIFEIIDRDTKSVLQAFNAI